MCVLEKQLSAPFLERCCFFIIDSSTSGLELFAVNRP
jgi:hypothetical protein